MHQQKVEPGVSKVTTASVNYHWIRTTADYVCFEVSLPLRNGTWTSTRWQLTSRYSKLCLGYLGEFRELLMERPRIVNIKCIFKVLSRQGTITVKPAFTVEEFYSTLEINASLQIPTKEYDIVSFDVEATIYFDPIEMNVDNTQCSPMKSLFEDKVFSDITIKCGDECFSAHKAILASRSPVFRKMLEVDMKEKSSNVIEIVDIDPPVMSDLLAYLYTGTAPNMKETAKDLLYAANKYEIPELFIMCEVTLQQNLKATNVVDTLILADLHNSPNLKTACCHFIQDNSAIVMGTSQWKSLHQNCDNTLLMEILEFLLQ